jgi:hypothetical protein
MKRKRPSRVKVRKIWGMNPETRIKKSEKLYLRDKETAKFRKELDEDLI